MPPDDAQRDDTDAPDDAPSPQTTNSFASRRGRADRAAFDRIMTREGGEPPRPGDEMPDDTPSR